MQIYVVFGRDNTEDCRCPEANLIKAFTVESEAGELAEKLQAASAENTKRWKEARRQAVVDNPGKMYPDFTWERVEGSLEGDSFWYEEVELSGM